MAGAIELMKTTLSPFSPKGLEKSSDSYLSRIRNLVRDEGSGSVSDCSLEYLEYRCRRRMQRISVNTLDSYFEILTTVPSGKAELGKLLQELKLQPTFFTNLPQLDEFHLAVLPKIVDHKKKTALAHVRIWSVECSTGEDAYSLAMILQQESSSLMNNCTFEVLGTDAEEQAVNFARRGVYDLQSARSVNPHLRQSYFVTAGDQLKVNLQIKARVSFNVVDLLNDAHMTFMKSMDPFSAAMFCPVSTAPKDSAYFSISGQLFCRTVICSLVNRSLCMAPVRTSNCSICGQIASTKK